MLKKNELSIPSSCFNRAEDREPVFVLLGRDACAPEAVRDWCAKRVLIGKNERTDPQIVEALALANQMEEYRAERQRELELLKAQR